MTAPSLGDDARYVTKFNPPLKRDKPPCWEPEKSHVCAKVCVET